MRKVGFEPFTTQNTWLNFLYQKQDHNTLMDQARKIRIRKTPICQICWVFTIGTNRFQNCIMEFWNFARLFWSWCPKLFGREGEGFAPGQRSTFKQFLPNKGEGGQKFYILQLSSIWRKKVFGVRRGNKFVITAKRRRRDKTKSSQNQVSKMRQSKGGGSEKKVPLDSKEI